MNCFSATSITIDVIPFCVGVGGMVCGRDIPLLDVANMILLWVGYGSGLREGAINGYHAVHRSRDSYGLWCRRAKS